MSSNHSNKERPEDRGPGLYLERTPSSGSEREIDEVVPEFMHRAFYRSTEDEYQTVEPAQLLRSKRRTKFVERKPESPAPGPAEPEAPEPVGDAPAPLRSPEPARPQEPLSPLRSHSPETEEYNEDTVAVPLRKLPRPPQSPPPASGSWPPSAPKSTGINYPIVICLLAVIGLFIWREQTRPPIPAQQPLPIPERVQVTEREPQPPAALGEDSPYPEMSPQVAAPNEDSETVVTADGQENEPADPERAAILPEQGEEESTTYPSREASAQRAAILERMSDGTVSNMERASREPAQPAQETSLFPATEQASSPPAQPWTVPESSVKKPPETAKGGDSGESASESLFPVEAKSAVQKPVTTQPVATKPPAAQKPPVKANPPAQPTQGEPYQIAEPTF